MPSSCFLLLPRAELCQVGEQRREPARIHTRSCCCCGGGCIPRVNYWHSFLCAEVDALNDSHSVAVHSTLPASHLLWPPSNLFSCSSPWCTWVFTGAISVRVRVCGCATTLPRRPNYTCLVVVCEWLFLAASLVISAIYPATRSLERPRDVPILLLLNCYFLRQRATRLLPAFGSCYLVVRVGVLLHFL